MGTDKTNGKALGNKAKNAGMTTVDKRELQYLAKKEVKVIQVKKKQFCFSKLHPSDTTQAEGAIDLAEISPRSATSFSFRGNMEKLVVQDASDSAGE